MKFTRLFKLSSFLLLASTVFSLTVNAASDLEFDAGLKSYKAKDYQSAASHFSKSIEAGNRSASAYLYSAHSFSGLGQYRRAFKTYEIVVNSFKGSAEATSAAQAMEVIRTRAGMPPAAPVAAAGTKAAAGTPSSAVVPAAAGDTGLMTRINVIAPMFGHPAVSPASIKAVREGIAALPKIIRDKLDPTGAHITLAPNMVDRWPESIKDLNEDDPAPNLAELPGRIYGDDICIYERAKARGTTALKEARPLKFTHLQVGNMSFQVFDDLTGMSKEAALRKEWQADKEQIPPHMVEKLATFMKEDDWGPRETCSELVGSMIGGVDENTEALYRYFPRTKKWLGAHLGLK